MRKALKLNDISFLIGEKATAPAHVAAMATFHYPPDAGEDYLQNLVRRWRECRQFAAPFNYRYRPWPFPSWDVLNNDEVDLDYHFRHSALPRPGGERELGVLISRLHSHPLDRNRPLWECHVIEGLEDGRFALYLKVHHSQVDGVGGIRMLNSMMADAVDAPPVDPIWAVGMERKRSNPDEPRTPRERPKIWPALKAYGRLRGAMLRRRLRPRHEPDNALPFATPRTSLNGRIGAPRRFATQQYDQDRIRAIASAAGCSTNDVFLAISAGALRRYLEETNALPAESLTAAVPVSVRPADETEVGNAITFIMAKMRTDIADPAERLAAIHRSTTAAKGHLNRLPKAAMDPYTAMLMGPYLIRIVLGLGAATRPMFNLAVSNVPGPKQTLYLDGATLDAIYPVSLLFNGQALNISLVSYDNKVNLGFTGCRDSLPHMQRIAVYTGEALDELDVAVRGESAQVAVA
ncbi:wax ester/triacylglycerol synthase family O-acyltransferase [Spectribacter hydrogenoxidans]|uniref:diacylglycerol O-acyltransferase n=1 Tax=Spectribacter hydrogenoxidans TaxID=3075608 RepID=A0ABU3BWU7_9GAMM|nr:wax ester/triacylglycerol synthase family O-acyltransferase [Salinisphaera sp. W335]MDT0633757.1 wax ester/triacylglycerol synthase family O-acyltransferase [Salinisphaera sp. W335]